MAVVWRLNYPLSIYVSRKIVQYANSVPKTTVASFLFVDIELDAEESHLFDELSKREIEILYCVSTGFSNKEIAAKLFLAEKTIKNNLTKLFKKMDVKDRVHAAIFCINNNIEEYYNRD